MLSSAVWAGQIPIATAHALPDIFNPSATVRSELQRTGFLGATPCSYKTYPLAAHFELHIEQGPILESSGRKIGVVRGSQAYKWLTITVDGRDAHTGTTPLGHRSDAILAAAKMVTASNAIAKGRNALASTGVIKIPPGSSTNTLASQVTFTLDIRNPDDAVVAQVLEECLARFAEIAKEDGRGVSFSYTVDTDSPAVKFHKDCVGAVRTAADELVGSEGWLEITSGAGHDSVCTSTRCPTTMIFVPCRDGVSHHPEEYCSPEDW
jgi:hydantoinase/carbamoylase family amidase